MYVALSDSLPKGTTMIFMHTKDYDNYSLSPGITFSIVSSSYDNLGKTINPTSSSECISG